MGRGLLKACFILAAVLQSPGVAEAQPWKKLEATDFPAWVEAVVFDRGVWTSQHPWVSGQWKAQFAHKTPVARMTRCDTSVCPDFRVENLTCLNPVVGESRCVLTISWSLSSNEGRCAFDVEKEKLHIPIRCPLEVKFKE